MARTTACAGKLRSLTELRSVRAGCSTSALPPLRLLSLLVPLVDAAAVAAAGRARRDGETYTDEEEDDDDDDDDDFGG